MGGVELSWAGLEVRMMVVVVTVWPLVVVVEVGMEWRCNAWVFKDTSDSRSIKSFIQ